MSQILLGIGKDEEGKKGWRRKKKMNRNFVRSHLFVWEWQRVNERVQTIKFQNFFKVNCELRQESCQRAKIKWIHTMLRDYLIYRDCYHSVASVVTSRIKLRWLSASLKNMITADNLPQPSKTESNPGMPYPLGALSSYGVGWGELPENVQVQSSTSEQASQCNCSSMDDEME